MSIVKSEITIILKGKKRSGKSTLIEILIPFLEKEGYKIIFNPFELEKEHQIDIIQETKI